MGYADYYNPYYDNVMAGAPVAQDVGADAANQGAGYNYGQPIDTTAAAPEKTATDEAEAVFDQSRAAFKTGDYAQALSLCDSALQKLPNDPALHEFRALILFALKRYDDASAALFAVLTGGPGWDWTTLIGLYSGIDVYTDQLRALEDYVRQNTSSAPARFLLAYHYMTEGHNQAAADQFKAALQLQPKDTLSAKFVQLLTDAARSKDGDAPAQPAEAPVDAPPARSYSLTGAWTASPTKNVSIGLNLQQDGAFVWNVKDKGKDRQFKGTSNYGNNLLTLAPPQGMPMTGKITWTDEKHFTFQVAGGGPNDPGLAFSR
jgi:tetratricopeptide (TPR) repeat protein